MQYAAALASSPAAACGAQGCRDHTKKPNRTIIHACGNLTNGCHHLLRAASGLLCSGLRRAGQPSSHGADRGNAVELVQHLHSGGSVSGSRRGHKHDSQPLMLNPSLSRLDRDIKGVKIKGRLLYAASMADFAKLASQTSRICCSGLFVAAGERRRACWHSWV